MMRIAPDINDPFPKPTTNSNGNGGKGGSNKSGFMPGEIKSLAQDMVASNGGTQEKWAKYLRGVYSPVKPQKYNYAGGNGKGGGKNDPTKPGTGPNGTGGDNGGVVPTYPGHNRSAPMAMPYGVMAGMQPGMGVLSGIPMQQPQTTAQQPRMQMPNEGVLAMLRARMGR